MYSLDASPRKVEKKYYVEQRITTNYIQLVIFYNTISKIMSKFFLKYFSTILTDFFTGLSLGEMAIFEVQFTTIFGPFDHGLRAAIARNRNGMEVTLESFHIIQVITRRFSFKEKRKLQTLFSKDYSENNNEKSSKTNKV